VAVRIRLCRAGRRHLPYYHIVVHDIRERNAGDFIARIGTYDPANKSEADQVKVDAGKAAEWLGKGATPSETVASILKKAGVEIPAPKRRGKPRKARPRTKQRSVKERTKKRTANSKTRKEKKKED
jgi:small subunit ribosomal protein S16